MEGFWKIEGEYNMNAKVYRMSEPVGRVTEPVVRDEHVQIMHIVLPTGEDVPQHNANAIVYLSVLQGTLTIALDGEAGCFPTGTILNIEMGTPMHIRNECADLLELMVTKIPAPAAR